MVRIHNFYEWKAAVLSEYKKQTGTDLDFSEFALSMAYAGGYEVMEAVYDLRIQLGTD